MTFATRRRLQHHTPIVTTTAAAASSSSYASAPRRVGPIQKRKPTLKDKVSCALLKLKGSLTRRSGLKGAGTRRIHGTDGRRPYKGRLYL